jgi:large subunit ribosomal protein L32
MKLNEPYLIECGNCGNKVLPHRVCGKCGFYRGKQILELEDIS